MHAMLGVTLIAICTFTQESLYAEGIETKGYVGVDARYFTEESESQFSFSSELELYWQSENSNNALNATFFSRVDDTDDERTHSDIRELNWLHFQDRWELRLGIAKVFWGVTESVHLVDIINQTDSVESPDGEEKLGQPMVQLSSINSWGVIDAFVLPYFRERTFSDGNAPLGIGFNINTDDALYESDEEEEHLDFALRYSHTFDIWDVALSHFSGTAREPLLIPTLDVSEVSFTPFYPLIDQTGLELQATLDAWLIKLEAIYQDNESEDFSASVAGFEYTHYGVIGSSADLGLLAEFHYDSRQSRATTPLQNDIFLGARLSLNDVQDTTLLAGVIQDTKSSNSMLAFVEASRRFGESWVLTLDARLFQSENTDDPIFLLNNSDHVTLDISYYF